LIVIVATPYVGYPNGTAPTARVDAYARGLAANGKDVHIILLGPSEVDEATAINTEGRGVFRGVPFEYTSVSPVKSPSFLTRQLRALLSPARAGRRIRELAGQSEVEGILLYSRVPWIARHFHRVSRAVHATYIADLSEMPYYFLPPGTSRDAKQEWYGRKVIARFGLVVAISRRLVAYTESHLPANAKAILLPIMVDCDEYRSGAPPLTMPRLITYAGLLNEEKDGVATLMSAFAKVADEYPGFSLRLVGDSEDPKKSTRIPEFRKLAADLGIADRVSFTGQVARREIPRYLSEATVLALARPSSQQADAGFPTKLGEYLASGRPVVVTETGDIAEYLRDGESAYLVPPSSVDAFAAKLRQVLGDLREAELVGQKGRLVAERWFDYRVASRRLVEALNRQAE